MHVCFALMIGVPLARLSSTASTRIVLGASTRCSWSFVIVATANHFLSDAVLGA